MSVIVDKLDQLGQARADLADVQARIERHAPVELLSARQGLEILCRNLETSIKASADHFAPSLAHTMVGRVLQLVWTPPAPAYDVDKLLALAEKHGASQAEIGACRTWRAGFWSIRKKGKGA